MDRDRRQRLTPSTPVTLRWDNGQGLIFTRTISVDDKYMFTVRDTVANTGAKPVTLYPYAYVAREGMPREPRPIPPGSCMKASSASPTAR